MQPKVEEVGVATHRLAKPKLNLLAEVRRHPLGTRSEPLCPKPVPRTLEAKIPPWTNSADFPRAKCPQCPGRPRRIRSPHRQTNGPAQSWNENSRHARASLERLG